MPHRTPLQVSEIEDETRALRATLVMLDQLARNDFERLRRYLEGLDRRLQGLEAHLLMKDREKQSNSSITADAPQVRTGNANNGHDDDA